MRIRRLVLQGFKTFAGKTLFDFDKGITAVIGPNGSGKSNLADALRWVLGEQSYSTLRGRRTEDVIFSGSSGRAPLGMAEVSLLFDNEDGGLPVDFAEVEISRRAYRSGSNEYFINRRRVRLQDVEEVLGGLTSSYVVIHQGLIDEALSLRPRERRILLEEAAEVRSYHERREKAEERLAQTETNMTRIADLRSELTPRLRVLERQSHQARQRAEAEVVLHEALQTCYRLLWEEASTTLQQAAAEQQEAQERLDQARAAMDEATREATRLRQQLQEAQRRQQERRAREDELRRREAALRQEAARIDGEQRALQGYHQELRAEIERWRTESAGQDERQRVSEQARAELTQRLEQARADLRVQETRFQRVEKALQLLRERRQNMQQELRSVAGGILEAERRLEAIAAREEALEREQGERKTLLDELSVQQQQARKDKADLEGLRAEEEAAWKELLGRETALRQEVDEARVKARSSSDALEKARMRLAEARARLEATARVGAPGEAGAFLQQWADKRAGGSSAAPSLQSLLSLFTVPAGLEAALEAALASFPYPFLVDQWETARSAMEALAATPSGRATLVARDQVRPPGAVLPEAVSTAVGGEGLLLDHLDWPERERRILTALFGRVVLASDLEAGRRIATQLPPGWLVVTRRGESMTPEGITGGGRVPPGQSELAREKERQAMAHAVSEGEAAVHELEETRRGAQDRLSEREAELFRTSREHEERRLRREEQLRRVQELSRELARLDGEAARHHQRQDALSGERRRLLEERAQRQARLQELHAGQQKQQEQLERTQRAEQVVQEKHAHVREILQEKRTHWAVVQKEQENQRALEEMSHRNTERLQQQISEGERRLRESLVQEQNWTARMTTLRTEMDQVTAAITTFAQEVQAEPLPLDEMARWDEEAARRRQEVLEVESVASRAAVQVQRFEDRLREVLRRGMDDLGSSAGSYGLENEAFLDELLESPPEWARGPVNTSQPLEELEKKIAHLREKVRSIGPVNPLAQEEYRETHERHTFLGQQLQDLQDAARSLRQVIVELDQAMETRFRDTFAAINQEFQGYFHRLFGGGQASMQIVKMEEEDKGGLAGLGIEIIARPPGKRAHSLALLSGGERALTSAALLFAILKVNPRPFCLLDEVDAALDEANVGRFRDCLLELAAATQFILITHNRGTVEAAETLYGVTLADDGTSRILSLRLEEVSMEEGRAVIGREGITGGK